MPQVYLRLVWPLTCIKLGVALGVLTELPLREKKYTGVKIK